MPQTQKPYVGIVQRTRKSPYFDATIEAGVKAFSVYNHTLFPLYYESAQADYWKLVNNVTMWDVGVQRQVEITGPDAYRLAEYLTPRDLSVCAIGQCKYAVVVDENGGMINDPVVLRLGENHFWFSLADSDVLLWAKGLALGLGLDVNVIEPDVSPLAIQGPKSLQVMEALFGNWVEKLGFFRFREIDLDGIPLVVARSGWSKQGGYELYLRDGSKGQELWNKVAKAGRSFDIAPAGPSLPERVEGGLLSYGNDMTLEHNPYELNLDKFLDVDKEADYSGKAALQRIRDEGVKRRLVGLFIDEDLIPPQENHWPVLFEEQPIGVVTSATYSPRLERNIGLAIISVEHTALKTELLIDTPWGNVPAVVTKVPFI